VSETQRITVKAFCELLPIPTTREKPLVVYTFSSLKFDLKYVSNVYLPEIQSIESKQNVFPAVYDWSKNITGLFFYLKKQLMEYVYIIEITQSSIVTMHRFLETKLLELLCSVREKLIDYQTIHELEKRFDQIVSTNNPTTVVDIRSDERQSTKSARLHNRSIVRSFHMDETSPPLDDVFSQRKKISI
jgi:oligoribonuclease (3'-5' exoribonuclease)